MDGDTGTKRRLIMDTKLTIDEIELAIVDSTLFNKRTDIFVPNVSWGLLEEFKADFNKDNNHKDERVDKLYYCVPLSIKERVADYLIENEIHFTGILYYSEEGKIRVHNTGGKFYTGGRKLFLEEQLTIARLGCMRVWNLKKKLVDVYHENEQ